MTLDNFPLDHLHCTHKNRQKDQVQVKDLDLIHQDQLILNNKPSIPDLSPPMLMESSYSISLPPFVAGWHYLDDTTA